MENFGYPLKGVVHTIFSSEKYEAIHELIAKVKSKREVKKIRNLETAVIAREKLQSTGVGNGVAIAHGKTRYAEKPIVLLGISRNGIRYDSPDGKPVNFLFIIANHPDRQKEYITVLSTVARIANSASFREKLLSLSRVSDMECFFRTMFSQYISN